MQVLENKVALVTGGTSGIGKIIAIAFSNAGAKVVLSGRREQEGEETADLIRRSGGECLFVRSDVSNEAEVKALDLLREWQILRFKLLGNRAKNRFAQEVY